MIRVRLEPEAKTDLREAARWYEDQEDGLSARLLDEVQAALDAVALMPRRFALVTGLETTMEIRRALLRRFPYSVVFACLTEVVVVVAITHVRRKPGHWVHRLTAIEDD